MVIKRSVLLFIAAVTGLIACKNNDNVFPPVTFSAINVVNTSADTLNFYLNGTRQNNSSSIYPGGTSGYLTVPSGSQNYQFKRAGGFNVLFSIPLNLKDSVNNSLFVAGQTSDKVFSTVDNLLIDTAQNFSTIRFVDAAPDAGALNVSVGDTVNFRSQSFKSSSVFLPVGSGLKEIKVYLGGASSPKIDTTITLQPQRVYTLFAKGLLNGKGNSVFDVGIVLNQ
jgi:hypothetical protein